MKGFSPGLKVVVCLCKQCNVFYSPTIPFDVDSPPSMWGWIQCTRTHFWTGSRSYHTINFWTVEWKPWSILYFVGKRSGFADCSVRTQFEQTITIITPLARSQTNFCVHELAPAPLGKLHARCFMNAAYK